MYLGQAIIYLNPHTVKKFSITARKNIPELKLNAGRSKIFDRFDTILQGEILNYEVISIDCINSLVNFEIE